MCLSLAPSQSTSVHACILAPAQSSQIPNKLPAPPVLAFCAVFSGFHWPTGPGAVLLPRGFVRLYRICSLLVPIKFSPDRRIPSYITIASSARPARCVDIWLALPLPSPPLARSLSVAATTMYDFNVASTYGPQTVRVGLPPASLLKFPPSELPTTIPAPLVAEPTWKQPFNIPPALYNDLLDVRVPITVASVYAVTVMILNRVNKARGYKPYAFSHTALFKLLVVLHNVFLAIYSAWTFAGMFLAFRGSLPDRADPNGLVGLTDALCKINGPRGYGNAVTYNTSTDQWTLRNPSFRLVDGVPDPADAGRLWNQGLAYFGWIFYLSKFYEVVDTAIILAKGKKSSTLQTYHHAGAMMCMWAGIRYMAAPIWIFALVNSAIHAMMVCDRLLLFLGRS